MTSAARNKMSNQVEEVKRHIDQLESWWMQQGRPPADRQLFVLICQLQKEIETLVEWIKEIE